MVPERPAVGTPEVEESNRRKLRALHDDDDDEARRKQKTTRRDLGKTERRRGRYSWPVKENLDKG